MQSKHRRNLSLTVLVSLFITTGCASFLMPPIQPGEAESSVIAKLGQPTHRYADGNDHLLEYASGPWGQRTWMARIDSDGRLVSYRQVLNADGFGTVDVGRSNKDDVLRKIGAPSETSYLPLVQQEVWSYYYKESGAWDSIMHVHFDQRGIVQRMLSGPNLRFDPDRQFPLR